MTPSHLSAVRSVPVQWLGQSGMKLSFPGATIYVDPYLSNSVQELDAPDLVRLVPIPFTPSQASDADWILVTHEHLDHCDPHTLPPLAGASPTARFIGPPPALRLLEEWGIARGRLVPAEEDWIALGPDLRVRAVPAAHLEILRDASGQLSFVGYVLEFQGKRLYLAGDTCIKQELIDALARLAPISLAVLPVNEHNFFRARRGIVGNMSPREAFQFAEELGIEQVVPVHWDMFDCNTTSLDEIHAVYRHLQPRFQLHIKPEILAF